MADQTDLDPELLASLELFNEHLERSAADEKAAKAVAKAERRKTEAANRVRTLSEDPGATPEAKAEAEAAYRDAVAELAARTDDPLGTSSSGSETDPGSASPAVAEGEKGSAGSAGGEDTASASPAVAEGEKGSAGSAGGEDAAGDDNAG